MKKQLIIIFSMLLMLVLLPTSIISNEVKAASSDPLTFTANTAGSTIKISKAGSPAWEGYYSTDGTNWTPYVLGTSGTGAITLANAGDKVYFKGTYSEANTGEKFLRFVATGSISVSGNVMSFCSGDSFASATTIPYDYTFYKLFYSGKYFTSAPELPATTLKANCYEQMFSGCTGLTTAPTLPAETLASYCYSSMFQGCTNLTTAPTLNATTLAIYCYEQMFSGCSKLVNVQTTLPATTLARFCYISMFKDCTSLQAAPTLPATTAVEGCYQEMFGGCTKLVTAPELKATKLDWFCYAGMFNGCTSLQVAPALPATTLSSRCYWYMFKGCTSLQAAPELKATKMESQAYANMFENCTSLTTAPTLPAETLDSACYEYMFRGCTNLQAAPALPAKTLKSECYFEMFSGCTKLVTAPELKATTLAEKCYAYMFKGCTGITSAPTLSVTDLAIGCYTGMFMNCTGLTTAPELKATTLKNNCYKEMFSGCTKLVTAPELKATTLTESCYAYMFKGCEGITSAPLLPATTLAIGCYTGMFMNCNGLTQAPELKATTLKNNCYKEMFSGCTKLTATPELKATTLADNCYYQMFKGCIGLTEIPELPATTLANGCYSEMFKNCSGIKISSVYDTQAKYTKQYKITADSIGIDSLLNMFNGTSGPSTSKVTTPSANTPYYLYCEKTAQTIKFTDTTVDKTYGDKAFTKVVSGAQTTVTYESLNTEVATVNSSTGEVTIKGAGNATIKATAAEDETYASATATYALTVAKAKVDLPTATTGITYNGTEQVGVALPDKETRYTLSDNKKVDVGTYQAIATLSNKNNYEWNITTTPTSDDQKIDWSIAKRNVTLTSATASKVYNGTALKDSTVTVSGEGFVLDEGMTYDSISLIGSDKGVTKVKNTFTYTPKDNTKITNYEITKVEGSLTVIGAKDSGDMDYDIKNGFNASFTYKQASIITAHIADKDPTSYDIKVSENGNYLTEDKDYKLSEGSLKINFQTSYLNSLSVGTHKLLINISKGTDVIEYTVTIIVKSNTPTPPYVPVDTGCR